MAMTRLISQTLIHHPKSSSSLPLSPRIISQRHRSGKPRVTAQLIEVDLESSPSSSSPSSSASSPSSEVEAISGGIRKLEEVIQNIIARRSAPDWLPFRPGSSYWVPPPNIRNHPFGGVVEVIGKLSSAARLHGESRLAPPSLIHGDCTKTRFEIVTDDDAPEFPSSRGWPSASYFVEGSAPTFSVPMEMEVEVEVKVLDNSKRGSTDEDNEG